MRNQSSRFPLLAGHLIALLSLLAFRYWLRVHPLNPSLQEKQDWLFPYYWQLFPLLFTLLAPPAVALLLRLPGPKGVFALLASVPVGCSITVVGSLAGRALEGRCAALGYADIIETLSLSIFLFVHSLARMVGWQFLTIYVAASIMLSRRGGSA